jgi:hypothetical protein
VHPGKAKNSTRVWRGIGLKSVRPDPDPDKLSVPESPANVQKNDEGGHFSENFPEVQSLPPMQETLSKNDEKVSAPPKSVRPPSTFEVLDGVPVRFHGGEK